MKKFLLLLFLLGTTAHQLSAKNDFTSSKHAAIYIACSALGAGIYWASQGVYGWHKQTEKQKIANEIFTQLCQEYDSEMNSIEQLGKELLLAIIQTKNHTNAKHPLLAYTQSLNTAIATLEEHLPSIDKKRKEEAEEFLLTLKKIRTLKNIHLQADFEKAQKEYQQEQCEQKEKHIKLQNLQYKRDAAKQKLENEIRHKQMLQEAENRLQTILSEVKKQTNTVPVYMAATVAQIESARREIEQLKTEQRKQIVELKKITEKNNPTKIEKEIHKLNKKMNTVKEELKRVETELAYLYERKVQKNSEPSAPSYTDLYEKGY